MILWKAGVSNHFLLWVSRYLLTVWYIKSGAYVMRGKRGATNIGSNLCFGCNVWFDRPYNVNSTSSPFRNASENWRTCQIPIRKSSIEASDHGFPRTRQLIVLILTLTTRAISQNNEREDLGESYCLGNKAKAIPTLSITLRVFLVSPIYALEINNYVVNKQNWSSESISIYWLFFFVGGRNWFQL
jgi:hypothetical protein